MQKYRITVTGWLPENQYDYGGTPEFIETYFVEARSAQAAMIAGRIRFDEASPRHRDCSHIETTEGM